MNKLLLSAAIPLAFLCGPAFAGDAATGTLSGMSADISISSSYEYVDNEPNSTGDGFYGDVSARGLVPLGSGAAVQVDVSGHRAVDMEDAASDRIYESSNHYGAHLLLRDGETYQLGAFGGLNDSQVDGGEAWSGYMYGGEGQVYFDKATLWAQGGAAYQEENDAPGEQTDVLFVRGGARFFPTDNTKLSVEGRYITGTQTDYGADMDLNTVTWKAGIEHMLDFKSLPVSVFANYAGSYTSGDGDVDTGDRVYSLYETVSNSVSVGFSIKLGTGSLLNQDRHGPNTDMDFSVIDSADSLYYYYWY